MSAPSPTEVNATRRDVDRLVAFSDGVFAIAITLLVISIQVPDVSDQHLGQALQDLVPQLLTFALSFLVIGLFWMAHHRTYRSLARVNRTLLWINLLLLGFVAVLPLPTEVLGKYGDTTIGVVVYATAISTIGVTSALIWWYVRHAALAPPRSANSFRLGLMRATIPPSVFALSIPIAFVSVQGAELCWLLVMPANAFAEHRYGKDAYDA